MVRYLLRGLNFIEGRRWGSEFSDGPVFLLIRKRLQSPAEARASSFQSSLLWLIVCFYPNVRCKRTQKLNCHVFGRIF
jgi:hypothetical protein